MSTWHDNAAIVRAQIVVNLPEVGPLLTSIEQTSPQPAWLTQQAAALRAAHDLLATDPDGPARLVAACSAAVTAAGAGDGRLKTAVSHALAGPAGGPVRVIDQDRIVALVMWVIGRPVVPPNVYRRAVAPLVAAGGLVPHHPDETPDGRPEGFQWDRGSAYRAGYSDAAAGTAPPHPDDVARRYGPHADVYADGYTDHLIDAIG